MVFSLVNLKEPDMSSVIVLHYLTTSGICGWLTDDCRDEMAGVSGAGYDSVVEAVDDATGDGAHDEGLFVADLCEMGDAYLELAPDDLQAKVDAVKVPIAQWRSSQ
jgi:hypothetical protein